MTELTPQNDPSSNPGLSKAEREQADGVISVLLDRSPADWTATDFAEFEQAPLGVRLRVAELQWLHGLLLQTQRHDDRNLADLLERTFRELPDQPGELRSIPVQRRFSGRFSAWRRLLVAAMILICVGLVWQIGSGPSPAYAAVERALQVAGDYRDRQFAVVAELQLPGEQARKIESQLFVRGPHEFALNHPGLLPGGRLWIGSDRQGYWAVPQVGPVLVSHENGPLKEWLDQYKVSTPYLQLTTVLTGLRDRYALQEMKPESLSTTTEEANPQRFRHIQGALLNGQSAPANGGTTLFPTTIDLWVHPQTGEVRRLVLDWSVQLDRPVHGLQRVTFDLANFTAQSDDWYQHQGHHGPNRRILQPAPRK